MKANVLGRSYSIVFADETSDSKLKLCSGYCDNTTKEIVIINYHTQEKDPMDKGNLQEHQKKIIRHELVHAFLFESGLGENSNWAQNEEAIDWVAYQFPKLLKAFQETDCI